MWIARVDRSCVDRFVRRALTLSAAGLLCLFSGQAWAGVPTEQLKGSYPELARRMRAHQAEFSAPGAPSERTPRS
jgi:hypothetical protein